jgi:hypothetical protein
MGKREWIIRIGAKELEQSIPLLVTLKQQKQKGVKEHVRLYVSN